MSRMEDIAELTRVNKSLRAERDAALKRAEERYKDMMHANRRAERADQALKKEIWERHDDQIKATNLFCTYKETIHALQSAITHMHQAGSSAEHVQTLQTDNARLQATLAEQKEQAARQQTKAEETIRGLHAKIESDQTKIRKEAAQHWEVRVEEMKKQLGDEFLRKAQAGVTRMQEACKAENEGLKQKLLQATQMLEWQKKQMQQQTAQRTGLQSQQVNAGIHAGFPMPFQQSPGWPKEAPNKRRRLDSMGSVYCNQDHRELANTRSNAGIPTPVRQQRSANPTRSDAPATTPKRKSLSREQRQLTQQPMTPNRQSTTFRQQKRPVQASPLQKPQQSQKEPQSLPPHLQGIPKLSSSFLDSSSD